MMPMWTKMDDAAIPSRYTCRYPTHNRTPKVTLCFWLLQTALQISEGYWQQEAHTSCRQVVSLCRLHCFTLVQLLLLCCSSYINCCRFATANVNSTTVNLVNSYFTFVSTFQSFFMSAYQDGKCAINQKDFGNISHSHLWNINYQDSSDHRLHYCEVILKITKCRNKSCSFLCLMKLQAAGWHHV